MKTKVILSVIFFLIFLSSISVGVFNHYQQNHFSCRAKVYLTRGKANYFTLLKFTFDGGKGHFSSISEYRDESNYFPRININFNFKYLRKDDTVLMVSSDSTLEADKIKFLRPLIADFFIYPNRGYEVNIVKSSDNTYTFLEGDLPAYVCVIE
ncbi:hypothetical protein E5C26_05575 [Serratia proteamaculans]|uniref:hypothetical protein n=1 Tax=Serratia proteamaculans TaxID=28151 RepID=UPI001075E36C|nr:hypothetical protein [Serratia proteamaculans]TFZ52675.1 hypothetical protein E5C26_05575 [Serratia proteamaculans]